MKVYVSDKEENYGAYQSQDIDCHKLNFCNNEPMEIVSLEQHDKELLQEFVKKLKSDMPYWDYGGEDDDPSFYKRRGFQDCHRIFVNILEKLLKERGMK